MTSESNSKEVVLSFLKALNSQDMKTARIFIDDNVLFFAPDGAPVQGGDAYLNGWKPLGIKYEIKRTFAEGEDICVLYDISFSKPAAVTLLACGWYQVKNGKVNSIRVIFDPRPLLNTIK